MYFYLVVSIITAFLPIILFHSVLILLTTYCSYLSSRINRTKLAFFVDRIGKIWHRYEVRGLENIPDDGPALIVFYHGALPVDMIFFKMRMYLLKRPIWYIVDRFLHKIPNFNGISRAFKLTTEGMEVCVPLLKAGEILAVAPGGTYEALFGNENYELMWGDRLGFAKLALDCKVKVIPAFTQNIRESYRQVTAFQPFWLKMYKMTRLPIVPIFGGYPVKLTTYIGEPMDAGEFRTPEELKSAVMERMNDLIRAHQRIPGSISKAIRERWWM